MIDFSVQMQYNFNIFGNVLQIAYSHKRRPDMTKPSEKSSDQKQLTAFAAALFFSFNLLFFAPMEIYLYNLKDLPIPSKYVLAGCIPIILIFNRSIDKADR